MRSQHRDPGGFTEVRGRDTNERAASAVITVPKHFSVFAADCMPRVVNQVLREPPLCVHLIEETKSEIEHLRGTEANIQLRVKVYRKDQEKVERVLKSVQLQLESRSIASFVDPSRHEIIKTNLNALTFFDRAKREFTAVVIEVGPYRKGNDEIEKCFRMLQVQISHQMRREGERATQRRLEESSHPVDLSEFDVELQATTRMDPTVAIRRLKELSTTMEPPGVNDNPKEILMFHSQLADIDYHYILACLGKFEMHNVQCSLTTQNLMPELIRVHATSGDQWFTNRRPSVERGDTVILTSCRTRDVYRTTIVMVQRDVLYLQGNIEAEPSEKDSKKPRNQLRLVPLATAEERDDILLRQVALSVSFDLIFDTEKFGAVTDIRKRFSRTPEAFNALRLLVSPQENREYVDDQLERRKRNNLGDDASSGRGGRGRGTGRQERGGIFSGAAAPIPPTPTQELEDSLDDDQKLLFSLMVRPIRDVQKVVVRGPAGVGKTECLCRAIKHLVEIGGKRVLYLVPSKNAGDVAALRLVDLLGSPDPNVLLRLYPNSVHPTESEPVLLRYSNLSGPMKSFDQLTWKDSFVALSSSSRDKSETLQYVESVIKKRSVVITTVLQARHLTNVPYDVIVVDEVVQCNLLDALPSISLAAENSNRLLVMVGDSKQMGPSTHFPEIRKFLNQGVFHYNRGGVLIDLRNTHRYHGRLGGIINDTLYDGKLIIGGGSSVGKETPAANAFPNWAGHGGDPKPVRFIHIEDASATTVNQAEMVTVVNIVESLLSAHSKDLQQSDMVVFAPTTEQQKLIRERLQISGFKHVLVTDEESFQGDERLICISCFVSNDSSRDATIPFPNGKRRTTMVTRSQGLFIVVCNMEALAHSPQFPDWMGLIKHRDAAIEGLVGWNGDRPVVHVTWKPLEVSKLNIQEFRPQSEKKSISEYYNCVNVPSSYVLNQPLEFFVGVVERRHPTHDRWCIRNPSVYHMDVFLDMESSTGNIDLRLLPGDLIAVRLDPRLDRWMRKDPSDPMFQHPPPVERVQPRRESSLAAKLRIQTVNLTIDDFKVQPLLISSNPGHARSWHPVGRLACIIWRATLTAVPGQTVGGGETAAFVPNLETFPMLLAERYATGNVAALRTLSMLYYSPRAGTGRCNRLVPPPSPHEVSRFSPLIQERVEITLSDPNVTHFGFRSPGNGELHMYFPLCFDSRRLMGTELDCTVLHDLRFVNGYTLPAVELTVAVAQGFQAPVRGRFVNVVVTGVSPAHKPEVEEMANYFAAHYMWQYVPNFAVFVRTLRTFVESTATWNTSAETAMLPQKLDTNGITEPVGLGTTSYSVYSNITRFATRPLDQLTAALVTMAVLMEANVPLTPEEKDWLMMVPRIRSVIEGWARSGYLEATPLA